MAAEPHSVERCSRCVTPVSFPGAEFQAGDVCAYCASHKPFVSLGEGKLKELLQSQKGDQYDCVVPLSGGKDSTYILYYVVRELGLRAIAVNYDSGFQSDLAKDNAVRACEILNVPLEIHTVNYRRQVRMLHRILKVGEAVECFFHVCGNCETGIRTTSLNVARKYSVPFVILGDDRNEILWRVLPFMGVRPFVKRLLQRPHKVPRVAYHLALYCLHSVRQRGEMGVPLRHRFRPLKIVPLPNGRSQVVHFFDYVKWDPTTTTSFVREHLGWRSPESHEARFDCLIHCFGNAHWIMESGLSNDAFIDCEAIREGRKDRSRTAVEEEERLREVEQECVKVIRQLGLHGYRMPEVDADRAVRNGQKGELRGKSCARSGAE
jgi:hypothetical protein